MTLLPHVLPSVADVVVVVVAVGFVVFGGDDTGGLNRFCANQNESSPENLDGFGGINDDAEGTKLLGKVPHLSPAQREQRQWQYTVIDENMNHGNPDDCFLFCWDRFLYNGYL